MWSSDFETSPQRDGTPTADVCQTNRDHNEKIRKKGGCFDDTDHRDQVIKVGGCTDKM